MGSQPRAGEVGHRVAALAATQHGVVAHPQLRRLGLSSRQIYLRVKAGQLHPIFRGVYAVGHTRLARSGLWMAAVLAGGRGAALSRLCGAANFGLTEAFPSVPQITTPSWHHPVPGIRFYSAELGADEMTLHDGIPTTTVERTILDVCASAGRYRAERVIAEAEYRGLIDSQQMDVAIERYRGFRGVAVLRLIHEARLPSLGVTRSVLEERFLLFLDRNGLPRPELNVPMRFGGRRIVVDCLWRAQQLAVELDGRAAHTRSAAFESDRLRDRRLTVAGWRTARVTWLQLEDETELARDLGALLKPRPLT